MNNLFSSFDPQSFLSLPLNWLSAFGILFLVTPAFWMAPNSWKSNIKIPVKVLSGELAAVIKAESVPGFILISIALLVFIASNNFLGLAPYVFTASSHPSFTVALALPVWMGHMILAIINTPQNVLAHFVPLGTPPALMPFMVVIELVSSLIRPLTLSVRLAANMIAGHLLLTLLGNQGTLNSLAILAGVLSALIALAVLECAVALIQAYVFSVLSTLYIDEVNCPQIS